MTAYDGEGRWRAGQFDGKYTAEYLPDGQRNWRMLKTAGKPKLFDSYGEAKAAARDGYDAYMLQADPIRATLPPDPDKMAQKLLADREDWLRVNRHGVKTASTHYRPGKKPYQEVKGRARA